MSHVNTHREPHRSRWGRVASWVLLACVIAFIAFCLAWRLDGGRWERVETPSMGTVAPVGSLLWVKPVDFGSLRPGDFITFHPPGAGQTTYSHRVHKINADGTLTTKGVIPAPDPWRLTASDVVGEVRMTWWGMGWLVAMAPVLLIGGLAVAGIRSLLGERWKLPATLVLGSLVLSIAFSIYRPFTNAQQLSFAPDQRGGATATYVGTGLLPIRLEAAGGASVVMNDGQLGTVHVTNADSDHKLRVGLKPAIPTWWWLGLVGICFLPGAYSLVVGLPRDDTEAEPEPA
ncbi:S24/S26 family peptidase [Nocardioides terrisoli]|uniref:hypothetical protein n=1 Tax=Nocardioides terrisoli TaxID=3388267 RepID=UPI00287B921A|nr:hypothetical protein [Nocardioides marmorisolisilvae]